MNEFLCYPIYGRILLEKVDKNINVFGDPNDDGIIALRQTMKRVSDTFFNPQPIIDALKDNNVDSLSPCWKAYLKSAVTADYWYLRARSDLGRFTPIPEQYTKGFRKGYLTIAKREFLAYESIKEGTIDGMWPFPPPIPPKNSQELFYITDAFWIQNVLAELKRRTLPIRKCDPVVQDMRKAMLWPNANQFLMDYMSSAYLDVNLHQTVPVPLMVKIVGLSFAETNADFVDAIAFKHETEFLMGDIFDVPASVREGFLKGERALIDDARRFTEKLRKVPTW